jgi:hypothetical protein
VGGRLIFCNPARLAEIECNSIDRNDASHHHASRRHDVCCARSRASGWVSVAYLHGARQPFDNAGSRVPEGNASRRRTMKHTNAYLLTLPVVLSIAGFASSASAQDSAARDAAIGKCVRQAHLQYPNEEQQMQRADVYKACMVAAGFQP